jgi:ABC-2 type transport system permease protein
VTWCAYHEGRGPFTLRRVPARVAGQDLARTQMQAMQLTFFFLPSLLLSGFMFPYRGIPVWAQYLGEVFPLTHLNRLIRSVMLKGSDFAAVSGPFFALVAFSLAFALFALPRFRRTLD